MRRLLSWIWPLLPLLCGFYIPVFIAVLDDVALGSIEVAFSSVVTSIPVIFSTAILAISAAFLATLIGAVDALLISGVRGVTSGRLRFLWVPLLILTFTTPPAAVASAIQSTFGSSFLVAGVRDEFGALILLSLRWAPVALAILLGLSLTIPREQEWALRLLPPVKALKVRWQLQRNWRRACMLLLFLLMLPAAEIPSYAGIETISRRVMARLTVGDGLSGWILSAGLAGIVGPLLAWLMPGNQWWGRGLKTLSPAGLPTWKLASGWWILRVVPAISLILILIYTAWPRASEVELAKSEFLSALWNGIIEIQRALLVSVLSVLCCWRLAVAKRKWALWAWCLPTFLPASLLGLSLASTWGVHAPVFLDRIPWLLSLAHVVQLGALSALAGILAVSMIPEEEANAARFVKPEIACWRIFLPRSLPVLIPASIMGAILILGEVESTLLLAPPGHPSPALELHQLLHFRNDEQASRLALALIILSSGLTLLFSGVSLGRKGQR